MRFTILLIFLFICHPFCQGQSPDSIPLPERFTGLEEALVVNHFPAIVHPTPGGKKDACKWYWKHNTAVMADTDVQIFEAGAFLLIKDTWRQRVQFNTKEFARMFSCPKGVLKRSQPYTFQDNWRMGNEVSKGWAAWYFIGTDSNGQTVYGWGAVFTSDEI